MTRALVLAAAVALVPFAALGQQTGLRDHPTLPGVLVLTGDIVEDLQGELDEVLGADPVPTALWLDSGGGDVDAALAMAEQVHNVGLTTVIAPNAWCASACTYLFLAGKERIALGRLGVHQFMSEGVGPDGTGGLPEGEAQAVAAEIMGHLTEFGAPPLVMVKMLATPNDEMYWFTPEELVSQKIVTASPSWEELARGATTAQASE